MITNRTPEAHAAVLAMFPQARFQRHLHAAQPARHHPVSRHRWRRRMGRRGLRSRHRAALRQLQRAAVDHPHGDARHHLAVQEQLRRAAIATTARARRRHFRRWSTSASAARATNSPRIIREGTGRMPGFASPGPRHQRDRRFPGDRQRHRRGRSVRPPRIPTGRSIATKATFCSAIPTAIRRSRRRGARSTPSI